MDDDEAAVGRVLGGDRSAFEGLVRRHEGDLRAFVGSLLAASDRDDVCQDAFVAAWSNLASFEPRRGSFRAWLFTIARNLAANRRRLLGRRNRPLAPDVRREPRADERAAHRELFERLDRELAGLPDDQRAAFVLVEFQGFSLDEVSRMEGVPIGTVKSRLGRARARLREALERASNEGGSR